MNNTPTITILGTGYVGLTTAAIFSAAGIKTFVIDPNPTRLESVKSGKSFFYEEGLDPIIARGVEQHLLIPTDSYAEAIPESSIVISSVGTPDNTDGSSNLSYVFAAATEAAKYLKQDAIYVQKSTVPVGTGNKVKDIFSAAGCDVAYISNPEFLRESTALMDTLWFDRVVVGGDNQDAISRVMGVYRTVEAKRESITEMAGLTKPTNSDAGKYITVNLESAELIKVVSNAFLALKISFANSVALLADKTTADVTEVMDAVGSDARIGRAFLNAGRGYGGGCFPKDVSGLIATGQSLGVDLEIMRAAQTINEAMPGYINEKLQTMLGGSLDGHKIAVLGLAFKAGTSDVRRSPGIVFVNNLATHGATVSVYDPKANTEAAPLLNKAVVQGSSIEDTLQGADAVIIATDWKEFLEYGLNTYAEHLSGNIFVDAMNCFDIEAVTNAGMRYIGVGRGPQDL